jgi:excisionase family DNA binding protein
MSGGFKMSSSTNILTARDIAKELGVGLNFVYRELKAGRIPATKIGDRYFVSRATWEKFLAGEDSHVSNLKQK